GTENEFESLIEILDPFARSSAGYSYGWYGNSCDSLLFRFSLDDSLGNPEDKEIEILEPLLSGTGYGRRYPVNLSLEELAAHVEEEFKTKVHVYGDRTAYVKKAASFCGAGLDSKALSYPADVYISADVRHHVLVEAIQKGKRVIAMTHFASENYGLKCIYKHFVNIYRLKNKLDFYFFDDERFV
ncbi:MAG: Nif3-like dinuclear metal center hexameric protein, partial [Clostridia bacterium]|nr:Nif3-like dinuclear metal center hexameric protein [Clostridia bacterium]